MIEALVPDGPDKTYTIRHFREVTMWVNVAITRHHDGSPRA
jgi:NADPH-dependent ferric siderophore reductase